MNKIVEIKHPCPLCGDDDIAVVSGVSHTAKCMTCYHVKIQCCMSKEEAIQKWNRLCGAQARITELETITEEKVERVAKAMFEIDMVKGSWDNEPSERLKNRVRNQVRVGLKAAIGGGDE